MKLRAAHVFPSLYIPHVGQRIVKTTIAVFICLMLYWLRGYRGSEMPTESCITAIICMQPYVHDTKKYALNRLAGTGVGALWSLLFLLLLSRFPVLGTNAPALYAAMALGVLAVLYTTVLFRMPDTSVLAAIIFLCIVVAFPDIESPIHSVAVRILDIFIGTVVAICVNVFRLPRAKRENRVFFVHADDLVPDSFSPIPPAALFHLNNLYNDGAKISLMSEHAPAFLTLPLSAAKVNTPMIVMDGAAIYDVNENRYLYTDAILPSESDKITGCLNDLGVSYFIYTVHGNRTCVFHHGEYSEPEKIVYTRMKRSPYLSYLDSVDYAAEEIVYYKIIAEEDRIQSIEQSLKTLLSWAHLRRALRSQEGGSGISALYIYSRTATMKHAEKNLMKMLQENDPDLLAVEIPALRSKRSERDAVHLLQLVERQYEPVSFSFLKAKGRR